MAQSIRELRSRIRSVQSTKKITKAQELIATSRITKAQMRVAASKPYSTEITKALGALATASSLDHVLLTEREHVRRSGVLVVTSDRGMCGGYNHNVLKEARELTTLLREEGKDPVLFVMGRKGEDYYNFRGRDVVKSWNGFSQEPHYINAMTAARFLVSLFEKGSGDTVVIDGDEIEGVDELHIIYTQFESMLTQKPETRRIAPLGVDYIDEEMRTAEDMFSQSPDDVRAEYEFEPEPDSLLSALLPKYIATRIYAALLDSSASESAARRTAMKAATDNASELEKNLSRQANQARQAQITQEISEIVGGVAALSS